MTDQQSKALQLADSLEYQIDFGPYNWGRVETLMTKAAIELRRLDAENQALKDLCIRSLRALMEEDFPALRDDLRHALGEIRD